MTGDEKRAISDAVRLIEIANDPSTTDEPAEVVKNIIDFVNAMVEMGRKLRGEPTEATFVKGDKDGEIVYYGLIPSAHGGDHSGYFQVSAMLASTKPGTTGVRKKPPRGRLIIPVHIFATVATVDARRFRRCAICDKIFYAERLDASCCTKAHASQHRTNAYREKRKSNYRYKKSKTEGKVKWQDTFQNAEKIPGGSE